MVDLKETGDQSPADFYGLKVEADLDVREGVLSETGVGDGRMWRVVSSSWMDSCALSSRARPPELERRL